MTLLSWIDESKINIDLLLQKNPNRELVMAYASKLGLRPLPLESKFQIIEFLNEKPSFKIGFRAINLHDSVYKNYNFLNLVSNDMGIIKEYDLDVRKFNKSIITQNGWGLPLLMEYPLLFTPHSFYASGADEWMYPFFEKYPEKFVNLNFYLDWMLPILSNHTNYIQPNVISRYNWALPLLESHPEIRDYSVLSESQWALPILEANKNHIDWFKISNWEWALPLIRSHIAENHDKIIDYKSNKIDKHNVHINTLSQYQWALPLWEEFPNIPNYEYIIGFEWGASHIGKLPVERAVEILQRQERALPLLEANLDMVSLDRISSFEWAVPLIIKCLEKDETRVKEIDWNSLSYNKAAVPLFYKYPDLVMDNVSLNTNAIDFLKSHPEKINPVYLLNNFNAKEIILEYKFNEFQNDWDASNFDEVHDTILFDEDLANIIITKISNTMTALNFIQFNNGALDAFIRNFDRLSEDMKECVFENARDISFILRFTNDVLAPYKKSISANVIFNDFLIHNPDMIDWYGALDNEELDNLIDTLNYVHYTDEDICRYEALFNLLDERLEADKKMKMKWFAICSDPNKLDIIKWAIQTHPDKISWDGVSINPAILE